MDLKFTLRKILPGGNLIFLLTQIVKPEYQMKENIKPRNNKWIFT